MEAEPEAAGIDLPTQTLVAHRAYLTALREWERLEEVARQSRDPLQRLACSRAEEEKETSRRKFRDLVDELGFVPVLYTP